MASRVLLRLLSWIEAADVASQQGAPRPDFAAEDGTPIFPTAGEPDELWWLTEMSKRKLKQSAQEAVEEGEASDDDDDDAEDPGEDCMAVDKGNALLSDEDATSDENDTPLEDTPPGQCRLPENPYKRSKSSNLNWKS